MSPCKDLATLNVVNGREPCECTHIGILMIEVSYNTLNVASGLRSYGCIITSMPRELVGTEISTYFRYANYQVRWV